MEQTEYNFWQLKIENVEIEQQALIDKRDYWRLKLELLKETRSEVETIQPQIVSDDTNLNMDEVRCAFDTWLKLCAKDYTDPNNTRFHVKSSNGILQAVKQ